VNFLRSATIQKPIIFEGIGIHRGNSCKVSLFPANEGDGITFENNGEKTPFVYPNVLGNNRGTILHTRSNNISTVEHLMATLTGLGIDNCRIVTSSDEIPILDGSAIVFANKISKLGVKYLSGEKKVLQIKHPFSLIENDKKIVVLPSKSYKVTFLFEHPLFFPQLFSFDILKDDFKKELSSARTFGFKEELEPLKEKGLIQGAALENAILIENKKTSTPLRLKNELVRHKIIDFIGDLTALGKLPLAHFVVLRSGHSFNSKLVAKLIHEYDN